MIVRAATALGRTVRHAVAATSAIGLAALCTVALPSSAAALEDTGDWAPAATAPIHPGVQTSTAGAICTANFIFSNGSELFIGQAAHCSSKASATETSDGCTAAVHPIDTAVKIAGARQPGRLAYSSWNAMREAGETDPEICAYNDFALIEIDPADVARINPSMPVFGGPTGLDTNGVATGERVFGYGNSPQRQNIEPLKSSSGISIGDAPSARAHNAYLLPPVIPGDSGGPYVTADGSAMGSLIGIQFRPTPAATLIADLAHALAYANAHGDVGTVELVQGTEPFRSQLLPVLGLGV